MKASRNNFHAAGFGKVAPWVDLANSEEWNGFGKLTDHLAKAPWLATFLQTKRRAKDNYFIHRIITAWLADH